jgi:hypothetical protein
MPMRRSEIPQQATTKNGSAHLIDGFGYVRYRTI